MTLRVTEHYARVYRERAHAYDRMVAAEDCDGLLRPAIEAVVGIEGAAVVEVGLGTGRLTRLLANAGAAQILGIEPADDMIRVAATHLRAEAPARCRWLVARGDALALPFPDDCATLSLAGWVFGHFRSWDPDGWRGNVDAAVGELARVCRPGGTQLIFETLGTGADAPGAPHPGLADYYTRLERAHGFTRTVVRTDYGFASPEAAAEACRFFFGDGLADRILARRWSRVPEWTGLWCRRGPAL